MALSIAVAKDTYDFKLTPSRWRALALAVASVMCLTSLSKPSPFLYFQF